MTLVDCHAGLDGATQKNLAKEMLPCPCEDQK